MDHSDIEEVAYHARPKNYIDPAGTPDTRTPPFDSTIFLRLDPHRFVLQASTVLGAGAFKTRMTLEPTLWRTGVEAAGFFYDPPLFPREGVAQGGRAHTSGYRRLGEWITQDLMVTGTQATLECIGGRNLPPQDLGLHKGNLSNLRRDQMLLHAVRQSKA